MTPHRANDEGHETHVEPAGNCWRACKQHAFCPSMTKSHPAQSKSSALLVRRSEAELSEERQAHDAAMSATRELRAAGGLPLQSSSFGCGLNSSKGHYMRSRLYMVAWLETSSFCGSSCGAVGMGSCSLASCHASQMQDHSRRLQAQWCRRVWQAGDRFRRANHEKKACRTRETLRPVLLRFRFPVLVARFCERSLNDHHISHHRWFQLKHFWKQGPAVWGHACRWQLFPLHIRQTW